MIADMKAKSFEDKDKENLVKLLNLIHLKIDGLNGKEALEYHGLMSWAQQSLLTKVSQHILGEIKEFKEETPKKNKKAK